MNRAYPTKRNWQNRPSKTTPINSENLGAMDDAIYEIDGRVVELNDTTIPNAISNIESEIDQRLTAIFTDAGNIRCEELTNSLLNASHLNFVYNTTNTGLTTADFKEGAGHPIGLGSNVAVVNAGTNESPVYKFDLMSGFVDLSNYYTKSEIDNQNNSQTQSLKIDVANSLDGTIWDVSSYNDFVSRLSYSDMLQISSSIEDGTYCLLIDSGSIYQRDSENDTWVFVEQLNHIEDTNKVDKNIDYRSTPKDLNTIVETGFYTLSPSGNTNLPTVLQNINNLEPLALLVHRATNNKVIQYLYVSENPTAYIKSSLYMRWLNVSLEPVSASDWIKLETEEDIASNTQLASCFRFIWDLSKYSAYINEESYDEDTNYKMLYCLGNPDNSIPKLYPNNATACLDVVTGRLYLSGGQGSSWVFTEQLTLITDANFPTTRQEEYMVFNYDVTNYYGNDFSGYGHPYDKYRPSATYANKEYLDIVTGAYYRCRQIEGGSGYEWKLVRTIPYPTIVLRNRISKDIISRIYDLNKFCADKNISANDIQYELNDINPYTQEKTVEGADYLLTTSGSFFSWNSTLNRWDYLNSDISKYGYEYLYNATYGVQNIYEFKATSQIINGVQFNVVNDTKGGLQYIHIPSGQTATGDAELVSENMLTLPNGSWKVVINDIDGVDTSHIYLKIGQSKTYSVSEMLTAVTNETVSIVVEDGYTTTTDMYLYPQIYGLPYDTSTYRPYAKSNYELTRDVADLAATGGSVTGVKGNNESTYRTGDVNITADNIGLGNVGNYKAVSTVASQGLTSTEKSNARSNIGAGTSNFSGSYSDLTNQPSIPTKTSDLTNDSGFITSHQDISGKYNTTGGTISGDVRIKGSGNYGNKLNLGDGDYVYISEPSDDVMEIHGSSGIYTKDTLYFGAVSGNSKSYKVDASGNADFNALTSGGTAVCLTNDSRLSDSRTPTSHRSTSASTYGAATASYYGHAKLSDTYDTVSTSQKAANSVAASAWALQTAYTTLNNNFAINQTLFTPQYKYNNNWWVVQQGNFITIGIEALSGLPNNASTLLYTFSGVYKPNSTRYKTICIPQTNAAIRLTLQADGKLYAYNYGAGTGVLNLADTWVLPK